MTDVASVILAAGMGSRMKSSKPKVMHEIAGRPMVSHLLDTVSQVTETSSTVVLAPGMDTVAEEVAPARVAIQKEALGTGHAVASALDDLKGFSGTVLVLYGDTPLISEETLKEMVAVREQDDCAVVVLGFEPDDALEYGRLVLKEDGSLSAIVEFADADEAVRAVKLCNSGVMAINGGLLADLINSIDNNNAKGEYYLTDIVEIANKAGHLCKVVIGDENELLGVNNREQLSQAEKVVQSQLRLKALENGATLIDPESVFLSFDTKIGRDVVIEPNVFIAPGVTIEDNVRIKASSHLEGTYISEGSQIGPFARLRPGAEISKNVKIGNFVEVKKSVLDEGAKVSHLSYIGDASVGAEANIGAGTITCNYDGYDKFKTEIGKGAFIGSNTALVAPVSVGDGAIVGAGSTLTRNVEKDALAVERAEEVQKTGWAERFRKLKLRAKSAKKGK